MLSYAAVVLRDGLGGDLSDPRVHQLLTALLDLGRKNTLFRLGIYRRYLDVFWAYDHMRRHGRDGASVAWLRDAMDNMLNVYRLLDLGPDPEEV